MDAIAPSPPTPLPRSGGEGRIVCLCALMKACLAPLAPGRGEGTGVRGETPLGIRCAEPRMSADAGCFSATDEHGWARMNRRGFAVLSFPLSLFSFLWHGCRCPLTPDPSPPFRGRGEDCVFVRADESVLGTPLPRSGGEGRIVCLCTLMKARMAPHPLRGRGEDFVL